MTFIWFGEWSGETWVSGEFGEPLCSFYALAAFQASKDFSPFMKMSSISKNRSPNAHEVFDRLDLVHQARRDEELLRWDLNR